MKVISIKKEKILIVIYLLIIMLGVLKMFKDETVETFSMPVSKKIIVIDAGHGGWAPYIFGHLINHLGTPSPFNLYFSRLFLYIF